METPPLVKISDFNRLAVLDAVKIRPVRAERNGRYFEVFNSDHVEKILAEFESGELSLPVRDFTAALARVKNRIFESERQYGAAYGNANR